MNYAFLVSKIKILKNNTTVRHGALFAFFSFLNNGIGFILLIILAKYIAPNEYGELNLFNTFVSLAGIFISLCTTTYVGVSFFKKKREDVQQVISIVFLISTGMLLIFTGLISLFPVFFEKTVGINVHYQWIALLICYGQVFNSINLDIWRLEEKPISYGLYSMSVVLLNFGITLFLVITLHQGWLGRLYSQFYVAVVFFFISSVFLVKRKYLTFRWPSTALFKETIRYALPIIPHLTSFWLRQGLDRYIINYYYTTEAVGLFSFALNFANVINIVGTAFNATNSVFIFKKLSENYERAKPVLERQTRFMILFFLVLTIVVIAGVAALIPWTVPQYTACIPYLFPVCLAAFFQCLYLLYVNYLFYYERTLTLMRITFSMSVLQVLLSLVLTRYSVIWTAYISLIITMMTFFWVYKQSKKVLKCQS